MYLLFHNLVKSAGFKCDTAPFKKFSNSKVFSKEKAKIKKSSGYLLKYMPGRHKGNRRNLANTVVVFRLLPIAIEK